MKFEINQNTECWNFVGAKDKNGYGKKYYQKKHMRAHRVSYLIHKGQIPEGFLVCHKCDNPSCINPEHLFIGKNIDNVKDCMRKGRWMKQEGTQRYNAKLTDEIVRKARRKAQEPGQVAWYVAKEYAGKYGVGISVMAKAIYRVTWKHVK